MMLDMVVTKVTANPMETAGLVSLETPIKEHNPKNLESIKLLIKTMETTIETNLATSIATPCPLYFLIGFSLKMPVIHQPDQ